MVNIEAPKSGEVEHPQWPVEPAALDELAAEPLLEAVGGLRLLVGACEKDGRMLLFRELGSAVV